LRSVQGELNEAGRSRAAVQQELDRLRRDTAGSFQAYQKSIDALREEIARLRKEVEDLRRQPPSVNNSTRFSPMPTNTGSILLKNTYPQPVWIAVNGTTYQLAPGENRLLRDQPAGAFTYELLGVQASVERLLAADSTYLIHVHLR
jgi:hypothetical protein